VLLVAINQEIIIDTQNKEMEFGMVLVISEDVCANYTLNQNQRKELKIKNRTTHRNWRKPKKNVGVRNPIAVAKMMKRRFRIGG